MFENYLVTDEPILECVPNFSEGRDESKIAQIAQAIQSVDGAHLLHQTSDADHNRTVFTLAGAPQAVLESVYRAIECASKIIDLEQQRGQHPRMGATDVVPFVPIANCTMQECVQWAHQLAERVGNTLQLPVYMYEHAATCPERRNLADVRRGGYEHLKRVIHEATHTPDYGEAKVGKAGAVIIGARDLLIAYNVFLNSDDVMIAKKVARAIRGSSGGLSGLKALGMLVQSKAQVSMNIIDFRQTPLHRVMELIRLEAGRYGVTVSHSELIGLIPQQALLDAALWYLQLDDDVATRTLEHQLISSVRVIK
jgi:glutamate formiminotransferase